MNAKANDPGAIEAVIFDMDGVVTDTAHAHFLAWKDVFDRFLRDHEPGAAPFTQRDYLDHVDGIPRYDGVRRFLASRGIDLPDGDTDERSSKSVYGLGNLKLDRFRAWLEENVPHVFDDAVELISCLRTSGLLTGVVSASRNARAILERAHLTNLFDIIVGGQEAADRGLAPKPDPAQLIDTVKRVGVEPWNAIIIEDAVAGVTAGARAHFRLVIGVNRQSVDSDAQRFSLRANGADLVTNDLSRLVLPDGSGLRTLPRLPLVWQCEPTLDAQLANRRVSIFLDYDGTLSPIVADYKKAVMPDGMAEAIRALARQAPLAIISGRDLEDVRERVGVENVIYAGSHGFDISGPNGLTERPNQASDFLKPIKKAEEALRSTVNRIEGAAIERKTFAIAIHYRQVAPSDIGYLEAAVDNVTARFQKLRKTRGKKVFQIQPQTDWDKGRAVAWLLSETSLGADGQLPVYVGDDLTDEDAFVALQSKGVAIAVRGGDRPTLADFTLEDPDDVRRFLIWLAQRASASAR